MNNNDKNINVCSECGAYNEDGHELTANKKPKCAKCWELSRHEWGWHNPTYDFYNNDGYFNEQRRQQRKWRNQ